MSMLSKVLHDVAGIPERKLTGANTASVVKETALALDLEPKLLAYLQAHPVTLPDAVLSGIENTVRSIAPNATTEQVDVLVKTVELHAQAFAIAELENFLNAQ